MACEEKPLPYIFRPLLLEPQFWEALREEATRAGSIAAEEFPHDQLDMGRTRTPGEVRQAALIAAMDRRRGHGTARAGCGRRSRREPEPHRLILNRNLRQADPADGSESFGHESTEFKGHNPI
jgi:hypothetical protein